MAGNPLRMVDGGTPSPVLPGAASLRPSACPSACPSIRPDNLYLSGLATGSRASAQSSLRVASRLLFAMEPEETEWGSLRYPDVAKLRAALQDAHAPATCNKVLSAVKGVLKEAWRLRLLSTEDFSRAVDVKAVRGASLSSGRALSKEEMRALHDAMALDMSHSGHRDRAMLAVLATTGMRRSELAALIRADWAYEQAASSWRLSIVSGKGAKGRRVYVPAAAAVLVQRWDRMLARGKADSAAALFPRLPKGSVLPQSFEPMTPEAVGYILRRRGDAAGLQRFTAHDMRRTLITDLLVKGVDINVVSRIAGHANVQTTARYDHRGALAERDATLLLNFGVTAYNITEGNAFGMLCADKNAGMESEDGEDGGT